jgi:hypothetical protein
MNFGEFLRQQRLSIGMSLSVFCLKNHEDLVNWSCLERSIVLPPKDISRLIEISKKLQIDDKKFFIDLAKTAKLSTAPPSVPSPHALINCNNAEGLFELIKEATTPREEFFK